MKSQAYFTRRIGRYGFSLAFTIPAPLCRAMGLKKGDEVRCYLVNQVLCVQRVEFSAFVPRVVGVKVYREERAAAEE